MRLLVFLSLALAPLLGAAGLPVLNLTKTTSVSDSTYFITRKISPDSVARKFSWGHVRDTVKNAVHDTAIADTSLSKKFGEVDVKNGTAKLSWVDSGSFLDTITGMTTVPTGTVSYYRIGNVVYLYVPAQTGTSNTTACTITTLPATVRPATAQLVPIVGNVQDNGTTTNGHVSIGTDGVLTLKFGATAPTATFTNTGTKGWTAAMTISYLALP